MSIIKKNIRFDNDDMYIQIPITGGLNFTGNQQEIDTFVNLKSTKSINDAVDGEVYKFKWGLTSFNRIIDFSFSSNTITGWESNYYYAGFTVDEVEGRNIKFLNSFYIMDFFNSYSPTNQTKIFSAYLTNLNLNVAQSGTLPSSRYFLNENFQLYNQYIPLGYLDITGDTYVGYSRFSFYNAKTGKIVVFYNKDNEQKTTPEKMYFKTVLNFNDKTWYFDTPGFINGVGYARELKNSDKYIQKYNNTFENFNNLQQNYPSGNTFDFETGKYILTI